MYGVGRACFVEQPVIETERKGVAVRREAPEAIVVRHRYSSRRPLGRGRSSSAGSHPSANAIAPMRSSEGACSPRSSGYTAWRLRPAFRARDPTLKPLAFMSRRRLKMNLLRSLPVSQSILAASEIVFTWSTFRQRWARATNPRTGWQEGHVVHVQDAVFASRARGVFPSPGDPYGTVVGASMDAKWSKTTMSVSSGDRNGTVTAAHQVREIAEDRSGIRVGGQDGVSYRPAGRSPRERRSCAPSHAVRRLEESRVCLTIESRCVAIATRRLAAPALSDATRAGPATCNAKASASRTRFWRTPSFFWGRPAKC